MRKHLKLAALSAALVSILATAVPAEARWKRYHDRRIDVDAGDVIAGIALIGVIAAIADAADGDQRRDRPRDRRRERERDDRYDRDNQDRGDAGWDSRPQANSRDAAADACILAVEAKAGTASRVDRIDQVTREDGGWRVEGIVRRAAADAYAVRDDFSCSYDRGAVTQVDLNAR